MFYANGRLIVPALKNNHDPKQMITPLMERADEMMPTMNFSARVCADPRYRVKTKSVLDRLSRRHEKYTQQIATILNSRVEDIAPCFCMCVIAVAKYMIFSSNYCISVVMKQAKEKIESLRNR